MEWPQQQQQQLQLQTGGALYSDEDRDDLKRRAVLALLVKADNITGEQVALLRGVEAEERAKVLFFLVFCV